MSAKDRYRAALYQRERKLQDLIHSLDGVSELLQDVDDDETFVSLTTAELARVQSVVADAAAYLADYLERFKEGRP